MVRTINFLKRALLICVIMFFIACSNDITGIWVIPSYGDAKLQLQQSNNQVIGYAYFQGQNQGQVYGQINGNNIVLQVRNTYTGIVNYTGIISADGASMQLRSSDGKVLTLFRTS